MRQNPNRRRLLAAPAVLALLLAPAPPAPAAEDVRVASPDGRVEFLLLRSDPGQLRFAVRFREQPAIEPSPLGVVVDGVDLGRGVELGEPERYRVSEKYPFHGARSELVNECNGARVPVRQAKGDVRYTVEVRAFNDGVAFRTVVPDAGKSRVPDEATAFVIPEGSVVWYHDHEGHYEGVHARKEIAEVAAGDWAPPPVTVKLPLGRGYASVTESALVNYAGMVLQADGGRTFRARLGHAVPPSYPFRLRYPDDTRRLAIPAAVAGAIRTPWRVVMVGADLDALVNCDVVAHLAPPPDPKLFPQGANTDWVKPGRCVWKYLDGGESTLAGMKEFSRLAGQLGFEYNLIEGFWQKWSEEQLRELVAYSKEQKVGVWLWKHSKQVRAPEERRKFFALCRDVGVVGVKLDFFDHEAKEVIDLYQACLRDAAEFKLMVDFHGANKPAGEARTWPNEMTREGIYGLEHRRGATWGRHNATLPFTRLLAGHADYTPVGFGERRRETSWAHQIATAAVMTSPVLVYGAHPKSLLENPAADLIKSIPSVWDETRALPGSEIGEVAALARRRGGEWFVAVVNGPSARTMRVPLSFLGDGRYRLTAARDNPEDAAAVKMTSSEADK